MGREIGVGDLGVKRDDLTAPRFGGNKVRTLEFVLPLGIETGHPLLLCAPVGSSWAAACSYYGHLFGVDVDLILFRRPAPATREPNQSIAATYSRSQTICGTPLGLPLAVGARWIRDRARRPRLLPLGGSSPGTALGFVSAALELGEQVRSGVMPRPDLILVPLGSGGTTAGLVAGMAILGWPTRVIAVRVTDAIVANRWSAGWMVRRCLRRLSRWDRTLRVRRELSLEVEGRFFGGEYGRPTPEGMEAARMAEEMEGAELDATYTAKTVAALIERARGGALKGGTVLYWHTCNTRDCASLVPARGTASRVQPSPSWGRGGRPGQT